MSDTPKPDRLFGIPGADQLFIDIQGAYESQIDPYLPDDWKSTWEGVERRIEEWTLQPSSTYIPSVDWIITDVIEHTADEEVDEWWYEHCEAAGKHADVIEAFTKAREALASHITYWMADRHVATHRVTWADPDRPLIDGEPLYKKAGRVQLHRRHVHRQLQSRVVEEGSDE